MSTDEQKSVNFVLAAVDKHHGTKFSDLSDGKKRAMFYKVLRSAQYKTVFFLSLNFDSLAGKLCAQVRKASRQHSGRSGRSYTCNVFSGKVTMMCFNDKCKKRNGGKKVLAAGAAAAAKPAQDEDSDASSSEDEDFDDDDTA